MKQDQNDRSNTSMIRWKCKWVYTEINGTRKKNTVLRE